MDCKTVRCAARDFSLPRPRTGDRGGSGIGNALVWPEPLIHRGIGHVIDAFALEDPWSFDKVRKLDLPDRRSKADHVGRQFCRIEIGIAPEEIAGPVRLRPHGGIYVIPVVRPRSVFILHKRAAKRVFERSERVIGNGHTDCLAMAALSLVMFDRGVEPVAPILLVHLTGPGIARGPCKVRRPHDRTVIGPAPHVFGRIGEPLGDVEHLVAACLVMSDIQIERVANYERCRISRMPVANQRIAEIGKGPCLNYIRRCRAAGQQRRAKRQHCCRSDELRLSNLFQTRHPTLPECWPDLYYSYKYGCQNLQAIRLQKTVPIDFLRGGMDRWSHAGAWTVHIEPAWRQTTSQEIGKHAC